MARLIQLALLGVLVMVVAALTASAAPARCAHATSSVGPAVLIDGHLARGHSDLTPHTATCVR